VFLNALRIDPEPLEILTIQRSGSELRLTFIHGVAATGRLRVGRECGHAMAGGERSHLQRADE
jgi:hypothetical protein